MVFRAVVFTFIPTAVELILVCGLLSRTFTPLVSLMVLGTFVAYTLWTAALTRAAAEVCLQLNATDDVVITVPANAAAHALKEVDVHHKPWTENNAGAAPPYLYLR